MKKCPTCDRTFDDGLRFCQSDGTPLVDAAETVSNDPFKTVVSNQNEISAPPADPFKTMIGVPPIKKDEEDLLELPGKPNTSDRQFGSEPFTFDAPPSPFGGVSSADESKLSGYDDFNSAPLEIPKMNESSLRPPNFGDMSSTGSSPKSESTGSEDSTFVLNTGSQNVSSGFDSPSASKEYPDAPVPSPFDTPSSSYQSASPPPFKEPENPFGAQNDPFNQSPYGQQQQTPFGQQTDWSPPPAPVSNWQDQGLGANTPFQPPVAAQGQNQTLAVVSLVTGILSIVCCGALAGIPAIITGYMAKNNIDANPDQYTGRGMATAGMIMGGISILFSILYIIYVLLVGFSGGF